MTSDHDQTTSVRAPVAPKSRTPREHLHDGLSMASSRPRSAPMAGRRRTLKEAENRNREGTEAYDQLRYELATVRRQLEIAKAESAAQAARAEEARQSLVAARSTVTPTAEELAKGEAQAPSEGSRARSPSKPAARKGPPRLPRGDGAFAINPRGKPRPQAPTPREARTSELARRAQERRKAAGKEGTLPARIKAQRVEAPQRPQTAMPKRGTELPPADDSPEVLLGRDNKFRTTSSVIGSWVDVAKPLDTERGVYRGRPKFIWASEDHPYWKEPQNHNRSASSWRPTSASIGHEECWRPLMASKQRADVPDMQRTSYGFLLTLNKECDDSGKNGFLGGQRL